MISSMVHGGKDITARLVGNSQRERLESGLTDLANREAGRERSVGPKRQRYTRCGGGAAQFVCLVCGVM